MRPVTLTALEATVLVRPGQPDTVQVTFDLPDPEVDNCKAFMSMTVPNGTGESYVKQHLGREPEMLYMAA